MIYPNYPKDFKYSSVLKSNPTSRKTKENQSEVSVWAHHRQITIFYLLREQVSKRQTKTRPMPTCHFHAFVKTQHVGDNKQVKHR